jgi:thioester reductase-like protein
LPHAQDSLPEVEFLLGNVGRMWAAGVTVDWAAMRGQARPRRIALPSYPFERQRYWPAYTPRAHAEAAAAPAAIGYARPALAVEFEMPCGQRELEIAALWQSLLGVDRLGRHDNFFELGGHSLLIAQMVAPLRERHRIELPLRVLFKKPTVAGFADAIDELLAGGQDIGGVGASEIQLPDDIVALAEPGSEASRSPQDPRVFLLTGATGFLGAFLLEELLARSDARVLCLVRARDAAQGLQRLRDNLADHRIAIADLESRVEMIPGDLAAPRLGLDDQVFAWLASEVDAIYHAGAQVNFVYPYEALKASNVGGTIEILRLATTTRAKPLHFMSTTGVFAAKQYAEQQVEEDDPIRYFDAMNTGYVESKWVAERIVHLARQRDIPVAIYRPAAVSGHQRTGASNRADYLLAMMQGCIALAAAPDVDISTYIAPVDFVASAIVALSQRADSIGQAFHLISAQPISLRTVFRNLRDLGYPIEMMSFADWRQQLIAATAIDRGHVLAGFLHMLHGGDHPPPPRLGRAATVARLTEIGHDIPLVDDAMLMHACRTLIKTGYLPPPPAAPVIVAAATAHPVWLSERLAEGIAPMNVSSTTASSSFLNRDWPWGFRLGLFDLFLPINYDQSLQRAFEGLHLTPGQRLIDVGSGSGRLVVHAARWLTGGGQLTCVDIDAGGLAYSRSRAEALGIAGRVNHVQRDVRSLSGAELPAFDAAISHFSVYCLPTDTDRRRAIVEIASVLRPGGRLVLCVPSERYQAHRLMDEARRIEQTRTDAPRWMRTLRSRIAYPVTEIAIGRLQKAMEQGRFHRYSAAEVESHLRSAGFTKIEIQPTYADCGYVATAERVAA